VPVSIFLELFDLLVKISDGRQFLRNNKPIDLLLLEVELRVKIFSNNGLAWIVVDQIVDNK